MAAVPLLAALVVLALAPLWEGRPPSAPHSGPLYFAALALLAAVAAIHAPLGSGTLALGACYLPPVLLGFGVSTAAWLAGGALVLRQLAARPFYGRRDPERRHRPRLPSVLADTGILILAALAAAGTWRLLRDAGSLQGPTARIYLAGSIAGGAYLLVLGVLRITALGLDRGTGADWRRALSPLLADALGWALGLVIARSLLALGWPLAGALLVGVSLLSLEAARHSRLRQRALDRVNDLREMTLAGHRIIFQQADLAGIAEQIQVECRRVLPFSYFQFELLGGEAAPKSWRSGPDGIIHEGVPEPPPLPPKLLGIHRRTGWRIIERELAAQEEVMVRLRFWCDPRQLEPTSLDLFDSLLPQMASSVQRALLDREARRDPLTDLPDRRVLESQLERVFVDCIKEGSSMAVVMCDLDRFKRINDRHGHTVGDEALIEVAHLLEAHRRESDLCCRYGGEEFAVVLEGAEGETALKVAERMRAAIERHLFVTDEIRVKLTVSMGIASFPELHVKSAGGLLQLADEALYEAKRKGRNRCLLNLGRRRFKRGNGEILEEREKPELEPPTLFA